MLERLGSVLEGANQSVAEMVVYVLNLLFAVMKDIEKNEESQKDFTRTGCDARV